MLRGHGYGLRVPHYAELLARGTRADCVEALTENFLGRGGRPAAVLERLRRDAALVFHGVSLSIGGMDELAYEYMRELGVLARSLDAAWISDHLCFGTALGHYAHDLWPLPYTEEALHHVVERVQRVQDCLGQKLLLENVSSYVEYRASTIPEWEFLAAVAEQADCLILLDLNNVVVNAKNHGFSASKYLDAMPRGRVRQLHLAGHSDCGTHAIDDHGSEVGETVWELYVYALKRFGPIATIVEWDENVPSLALLEAEVERARAIERTLFGSPS